ncbi:MAG: hypothetical protein ABFE02_16615 [Sulfuricella sp.]
MLLLLLIVVGVLAVFVTGANRAAQQQERDRITSEALAQAKAALIGYAASVSLASPGPRPGDLPCPDTNDDGVAETGCGNAAGTTGQNLRLGRLPWKTLGLPDLRDGDGERLWYAVSNNFKRNTRTSILNSDTPGTITVLDSNGVVVFDGAGTTGAIAVIFAPSSSLIRQDGYVQNRACVPCDVQMVCTAVPPTNTPRCNPKNYLDIANGGEDNANFQDGNADGFIQGPINAAGTTIVNDRLIIITPSDLMPVLEKRVAGEALNCLTEYAAKPQNQGRYPWAAPLNPSVSPSYSGVSGSRYGRIPDTFGGGFDSTVTSSGTLHPMDSSWTGNCNINSGSWWPNWEEIVFFAVADAYKPVNLDVSPVPAPGCGVTGTCLTVNLPSASANKQVVVFVGGRRLSGVAVGQPRTSSADKGTIANYLEGQNATLPDDVFERSSPTSTFNDATSFAP